MRRNPILPRVSATDVLLIGGALIFLPKIKDWADREFSYRREALQRDPYGNPIMPPAEARITGQTVVRTVTNVPWRLPFLGQSDRLWADINFQHIGAADEYTAGVDFYYVGVETPAQTISASIITGDDLNWQTYSVHCEAFWVGQKLAMLSQRVWLADSSGKEVDSHYTGWTTGVSMI